MATRRRTTMYSSAGKKLYAVRNADGTFKDIQTYQRAHAADLRHKSKAELEAAAGKPPRKAAKKAAAKKSTAKQAVTKAANKATASKPVAKKAAKKAVKKAAKKAVTRRSTR